MNYIDPMACINLLVFINAMISIKRMKPTTIMRPCKLMNITIFLSFAKHKTGIYVI